MPSAVPQPIQFLAANVHAPAAATAAGITFAAGGAGVCHVVRGIVASYSAAPAAGNLKIEDGAGVTVFSVDIPGAGVVEIPLFGKGSPNTELIITLASGGGAVVGKVNVLAHWTDAP